MRKLTTEHIRQEMSQKGWVLRSEYTGSQQKLSCVCPAGHDTTITWNNFQKGQGCRLCAGNDKHTFEEAKAIFAAKGCILLEDQYSGSTVSMRYRCHCGQESSVDLGSFKTQKHCWNCRAAGISRSLSNDLHAVNEYYTGKGCRLLSTEYIGSHGKLDFICRCGRQGSSSYSNFRKYPWCRACGEDQKSGPNCYRWNPDRPAVELRLKYAKACSRMLRRCLKKLGLKKRDRTHDLLGYTYQELQAHIRNHPDYPGDDADFHIDHIFPIKAFLEHGITDLRLINSLDNLRPLPSTENREKSGKYDKTAFRAWLRSKGVQT